MGAAYETTMTVNDEPVGAVMLYDGIDKVPLAQGTTYAEQLYLAKEIEDWLQGRAQREAKLGPMPIDQDIDIEML